MAKTKLGKLKELLAWIEERQKKSNESHKGHSGREDEIKRLKACLKGESKKSRMKGFAHKKGQAKAKAEAKANDKRKRGEAKNK